MKSFVTALIISLLLTGCAQNIGSPPSPINPASPTDDLAGDNSDNTGIVLGRYSTKLLDKKRSRLKNIDLSIEKINAKTINPGEIFSFNDTVGPRTPKNGFEKALIIIKKDKVLGYGGGVCQVSTTIYNAALGAGLEIVERHQHENEVGYVKLGDDATVSYGTLDLKIKNNKTYPIKFRVSVGADTIDAEVVSDM
ncbi:MAG: Vancomycin B-type resistance protein VanW [Firmicutes bacterium ADurb.Bin193]|nr:MAG: Vancomycin B-type resistance protein VanW [Firmicutes bacterium ADurb.Bin193]